MRARPTQKWCVCTEVQHRRECSVEIRAHLKSCHVVALFLLYLQELIQQSEHRRIFFFLSCKGLIVLKFRKSNPVIFTEAGASSLLLVEL